MDVENARLVTFFAFLHELQMLDEGTPEREQRLLDIVEILLDQCNLEQINSAIDSYYEKNHDTKDEENNEVV